MNETKRELIRDFSSYMESTQNIPPLTSKIFSYLLLDCGNGVTFDELIDVFNASKSSVSNSLNFLTQIKYIEYFTKIEDRKRFYRIVPNNLVMRLQNIKEMLGSERNLSSRLRAYKLENGHQPDELGIQKSDIYIDHLGQAVKQLGETIEKLKSLN